MQKYAREGKKRSGSYTSRRRQPARTRLLRILDHGDSETILDAAQWVEVPNDHAADDKTSAHIREAVGRGNSLKLGVDSNIVTGRHAVELHNGSVTDGLEDVVVNTVGSGSNMNLAAGNGSKATELARSDAGQHVGRVRDG